ncbi:hypothetical protein [Sphingomonas sp. SAFR-052]|uniref:hypothetical protein n=1 Tax=Sphingomonas sp. SAFR-052 TaxID=3436867 RepID=UPI003F80E31E
MREHIRGRYWAASWHPGEKACIVKMAMRYYRLTSAEWNCVIEKARATGCLVIVNFALKEDYATFDMTYGPSQFLHARPARRKPAT